LDNTAVFLLHWRRGYRLLGLRRFSCFFLELLLRNPERKNQTSMHPHQ
jgi:hypothetical protein